MVYSLGVRYRARSSTGRAADLYPVALDKRTVAGSNPAGRTTNRESQMNDDKKDALLQQIDGLIADPIPLLNLPDSDRLEWEDKLFTLAELLEDLRSGVLAKDLSGSQIDDAVARDAARYRWLCERTVLTGLSVWMGATQFLDDAIDAAMKEEG